MTVSVQSGSWHLTDNFTEGKSFPAFVAEDGSLMVCDPSAPIVRWASDESWPDHTPAVFVSLLEWRNFNHQIEMQAQVIRDLRKARDEWAEEAYKARKESRNVTEHLLRKIRLLEGENEQS